MKNKYVLPFALTTLVALSGCGGESANIIPEEVDASTENGSCTAGMSGCLEFALDYPLDGLNFTCSSDKQNKFITLFDDRAGAATGRCKEGDVVTFYLQGDKDKSIELGNINLKNVGNVSTLQQVPRLSLLQIASGISKASIELVGIDAQTKMVALRLIKIIQALSYEAGNIQKHDDVQLLFINDQVREKLGTIAASIESKKFYELSEAEFTEKLKPWVDISTVSTQDAEAVFHKLNVISTAAVFQPEFSLFATGTVIGSSVTGPDGLVGCAVGADCTKSTANAEHLFGHFMLITDRQGYTFGRGMQWRGTVENANLTSSRNAQLLRQRKPIPMTAYPQQDWLNPATKKVGANFNFNVHDAINSKMNIYQGRLYNDYMIAGNQQFYKLLTLNRDVVEADLGLWRQTEETLNNVDIETHTGSIDVYKIFPISYLDNRIFKTANNVAASKYYHFPMYADLTFKYADSALSNKTTTLGIVIDSNGDIRTNIKPSATEDDMSTAADGCVGDVLTTMDNTGVLLDHKGEKQYRLGTIGRTFVNEKRITLRMVFAHENLGALNGALIGMNTNMKISESGSDYLVVGGAILNLDSVLSHTQINTLPRVTFRDSQDTTVKWANSLASFQKVYNNNNEDETAAETELARYNGGTVTLNLANCYRIAQK